MNTGRRLRALGLVITLAAMVITGAALAQTPRPAPQEVMQSWYRLILELVRHTPTYSPPVASRAFAYVGVTGYEAVASGSDRLETLAGQLNDLPPLPAREAGAYDEALVLHSALAAATREFFFNTGPTGQRAMQAMERNLTAQLTDGLDPALAARSTAYGQKVAAHILAWSQNDGGAVVENLGFPYDYTLIEGPEHWVPTSLVALQQKPLLPGWGKNRAFAMPQGASCPLPPPPAYSEAKDSAFYKEALEVFATKQSLSDEQRKIARFWSDDPMLSPTPPGHWIAIGWQVLDREAADIEQSAEVMARLGVTLADAFIGCWESKFDYDLLRPVTYIRRVIDPKWEAVLNTPPFPEYPSGHSTQSAAAAVVLSAIFGDAYRFEDATHADDGVAPRAFPSFWAAAEEAGISRLYGGIHFRAAIERGLEQGRCVGAYAAALRTRK